MHALMHANISDQIRDELIVKADAICKATSTSASWIRNLILSFFYNYIYFSLVLPELDFTGINLNTAICGEESRDGQGGVQIVSVWRIRAGSPVQEPSQAWWKREKQRETIPNRKGRLICTVHVNWL